MRMPTVSGPVRARDLRANISELGFERGVADTLERMLEEHSHMRYQLHQLTQLVDACIDQVTNMVSVGTHLRTQLEDMKRAALGDGHDS